VPQSGRPARTPPVAFDAVAWSNDMARASRDARRVAEAARNEFELTGVPIGLLKPCEAESADGTQLEGCAKIYLPPPTGLHGMVLRFAREADGRLTLAYAAFGLRHPPRGSRQPSVYQIAHRRLHAEGDS
jgi:hypothetical protein